MASLVFAVAWVLVELRVAEPLIDMRVFAERPVLLTNVTALIAGFAMFGAFSLLPRFIEADQATYGFGASATQAGLYLVPSSLVMLVAGPVAACSAGASARSGRCARGCCSSPRAAPCSRPGTTSHGRS